MVAVAERLLGGARELLQGCLDLVLTDNSVKFSLEIAIELVILVTLLFGLAAIVDPDFLI